MLTAEKGLSNDELLSEKFILSLAKLPPLLLFTSIYDAFGELSRTGVKSPLIPFCLEGKVCFFGYGDVRSCSELSFFKSSLVLFVMNTPRS